MSMSREEVINALRTYSSNDWGVIRQPFGGWCWGIDDKSEEPYLYSEKEHIDKHDVFPEAVTTQSLETELATALNLPVTVKPEIYIDYRHRLLQAAIDKIKQFDKLFDGLVGLLPVPHPAQTTDSLLSAITGELKTPGNVYLNLRTPLTELLGDALMTDDVIIEQVKDLQNRNDEEFEALEKALSFALPPTTDRNHSILTCATQEITETRAMYEKAAAEHKDLRVRFGEMMGVSGPSNDEMVEFAYQANSKPVDLPPVPCTNKYHRSLKGETVDVYDVLKAFEVKCPALQHLIKKALCVGIRGHKDESTDLNDILESAKRAVQLGSK